MIVQTRWSEAISRYLLLTLESLLVCLDALRLELNAALIRLDNDADRPLFHYLLSLPWPRARRAADCYADLSLSLSSSLQSSERQRPPPGFTPGLSTSSSFTRTPSPLPPSAVSRCQSLSAQRKKQTLQKCVCKTATNGSPPCGEDRPGSAALFSEYDAHCDTRAQSVRLIGMNC